MSRFDFVVVGAGIVGLTIAREIALRKLGSVLVIDKEKAPGYHASGRNSGVVHAGIYYAADSLKAKFCVEGHRLLTEYVDDRKLPHLKCGKVIVATKPETVATLDVLWKRAEQNGVEVKRLDQAELREIEPEAKTFGWAIWSPKTSVIDSKSVLKSLSNELVDLGVKFKFESEVLRIAPDLRNLETKNESIEYGFLVNAAGIFADKIARPFKVGLKYQVLPFKGLYWKSSEQFRPKIRGLIYPAPDVDMPFLGLHITKTVNNDVLFGPTAIPAFGRENYTLTSGINVAETSKIGFHLAGMLWRNPGNFRKYVREELARYRASEFYAESKRLVQNLTKSDIGAFYKVGIRPQLMDLEKRKLEMDFVLEKAPNSIHVLNAISPAFTCALAFCKSVVDQISSQKS